MINSTNYDLTDRAYNKNYDGLKQGYIDMHQNIELFLYHKDYIKNNLKKLSIKRICKNGSFTIYEINMPTMCGSCRSMFFEVQACLAKDYYTNPGYYMTFNNIMGNWYANVPSKSKMFKRYSKPKDAVKAYIKGLINSF